MSEIKDGKVTLDNEWDGFSSEIWTLKVLSEHEKQETKIKLTDENMKSLQKIFALIRL